MRFDLLDLWRGELVVGSGDNDDGVLAIGGDCDRRNASGKLRINVDIVQRNAVGSQFLAELGPKAIAWTLLANTEQHCSSKG